MALVLDEKLYYSLQINQSYSNTVFKLQQHHSLSDEIGCGVKWQHKPQRVTQIEAVPGSEVLPTRLSSPPHSKHRHHNPASVKRRLLLGLSNLLANKFYIPVALGQSLLFAQGVEECSSALAIVCCTARHR